MSAIRYLRSLLIIFTLIFFNLTIMNAQTSVKTGPYENQWKEVDSLIEKQLPKSALAIVDRIYSDALKRQLNPEVVRAVTYRIAIKATFEEEVTPMAIQILTGETGKSSDPIVTAIFESMLAEVYLGYYRQNYYRFSKRGVTSGYDEQDFRLWDITRLVDEITLHYKKSLANDRLLKETPLKNYHQILQPGKESQTYRPTLYDLLAHRALEFFTSDITGLSRPAEQFTLDDPAYLGDNNTFVNLTINKGDTQSLLFQAVQIYRELTLFHLKSNDPRAMVEITIDRLKFARQKGGSIPQVDKLYIDQLENQAETYKSHSFYPWLRYQVADIYFRNSQERSVVAKDEDGKLFIVKAWEVCSEAIERYPKGEGVAECKNLISNIEQKQLWLNTPEVIPVGQGLLFLTEYRNLSSVNYRLIRVNYDKYAEMNKKEQEEMLNWLKSLKPVQSWVLSLEDRRDFLSHSFEYGVPINEPGFYVLMSSSSPSFGIKDNEVAISPFQVSNISYVSRTGQNGEGILLVTDRTSGAPLSGIKVIANLSYYDYSTRKWTNRVYGEYITNKDGLVRIPPQSDTRSGSLSFVFAGSKGDTLQSITSSYYTEKKEVAVKETYQNLIFLDRKIYRPGQTVYFKGIMIRSQGKVNSVAVDQSTTVKLLDVNRKMVAELTFRTNEYGSFQGSFVLPVSGLTGQYVLSTDLGSEYFIVEEYKRPRFSVDMMPVTGSYRPGDEVVAKGKAEAYAGFSLTGANVKWRVTREVRYPWITDYRYYPIQRRTVEVAQGETVIGEDGVFSIRFKAVPEPGISPESNPAFYYVVSTDVTDLNGETHSGNTTIAVGYTTLLLTADVPGEVEKGQNLTFPIKATNLNMQPVKVPGRWILYRIPEPKKVYRKRLWKNPDTWLMEEAVFRKMFPYDHYRDDDNKSSAREKVADGTFSTPDQATVDLPNLVKSPSGTYLLVLEAEDPFGGIVTGEKRFLLFGKEEKNIPEPAFFNVRVLKNQAEPGEVITILVGSSESTHLSYSIEVDGRVQEERWIALKGRQHQISIPVMEHHRGGIVFHYIGVYQNRSFTGSSIIGVPYSNKKLDISFATFRDKLQPGEKEEYRIIIRGPGGERVMAELLSGMYDASLDQFASNDWTLSPFQPNRTRQGWSANLFGARRGSIYGGFSSPRLKERNIIYDRLNWFGFDPVYGYYKGLGYFANFEAEKEEGMTSDLPQRYLFEGARMKGKDNGISGTDDSDVEEDSVATGGALQQPVAEQPAVQPRTNFNETAFFYPQLKTDDEGNVVFSYTVPESLTAWKLLLLAHTPDLKAGTLVKKLVTQKELMVIPNAPRFFRENDRITFTAKVTNLSDVEQTCNVVLKLTNGLTGDDIDGLCGNLQPRNQVLVKPGQSGLVSWELKIPERTGAITYHVTAISGTFSDGEEMTIPVLTNRMLVTESMPLWLKGRQTKSFRMDKLLNSGTSSTLRHHKLTLEYTSNPAWYVIQALPYLMEFPYECLEQTFSRFYANALASHIANSQPRIKAVFEVWRDLTPDALMSNLEKNQELKALLVEETPWVRDAASETDRKQRIALLFDLNRMADEMSLTLTKLRDQQVSNGGWPWFKGGPDSWYITQHIVTGIGRLQAMDVLPAATRNDLEDITTRAVAYIDARMNEHYLELKKTYHDKPSELQKNHLTSITIMYLYTRSFYMKSHPLPETAKEAFGWLKKQALAYWTGEGLMMQGYLAVALNRLDERTTALLIMRSLKERSLVSEEMGRYWSASPGFYWYEAPIERQAILIEAFAEVSGDADAVEEMKAWLLKQKQTQDWKTTKATVEACYALLLRGTDLLAETEPARITVGSQLVDPYKDGSATPEAGTGYFKVSWSGVEVTPAMGNVTVTGSSQGVSWGALYWQYFENLDKITGFATPLEIRKKLFVEENTPSGVVMKPITDGNSIKVGDRIVVRIELRVDRDMEYVHMKDMRASAFEPVTTVSGYRWQGGLGYYESPRDAAVNFFFDYLRKGTYLFEYKLFATHAGEFSNGITTIQCMYAPEFASNSEGIRVVIE